MSFSRSCKHQRLRAAIEELKQAETEPDIPPGTRSELGSNTFFRDLELATLGNLDGLLRLVASTLRKVLNLVDDVVTLEDLTEDNVTAIEPGCDGGGDEELRAVGVLAGVGHAWEQKVRKGWCR